MYFEYRNYANILYEPTEPESKVFRRVLERVSGREIF